MWGLRAVSSHCLSRQTAPRASKGIIPQRHPRFQWHRLPGDSGQRTGCAGRLPARGNLERNLEARREHVQLQLSDVHVREVGVGIEGLVLVGQAKALQMCLTGDPVSADEAFRIGLVNQVVPAAELDEAVAVMVKKLMSKGAIALDSTKKRIYATLEMPLEQAIENEGKLFSEIFKTEDAEEGAQAFLEKRKPEFKGK